MAVLSAPLAYYAGAGIVGFFLVRFIASAIYSAYFHPLSKYPSPPFASWSAAWRVYHTWKGDLSERTRDVHTQYGEIVRIGPDEVSYTSPQAWKDIYGHQTNKEIRRHPDENATDIDPAHVPLVIAERDRHAYLRKLLSNAFSDRALRDHEDVILTAADKMVSRLTELSKNGAVDLTSWYRFITFDLIGWLTFNRSFGCLDSADQNPLAVSLALSLKYLVLLRAFSRFRVARYLLDKLAMPFLSGVRKQLFAGMRAGIDYRLENRPNHIDLMTHFVERKEKGDLQYADLTANASMLITAGSETGATLLAGCTYYSLKNPEWMAQLKTEIRGAFAKSEDINYNKLTECKILQAVMTEGIRVYTPNAGTLLRQVPGDGAVICGDAVPAWTGVGINLVACFGQENNFRDALKFDPSRFLGNEYYKDDRKEVLNPFGTGPRNCIGKNLAYRESRIIFAKMIWHFDMELENPEEDWTNQRAFIFWERPPLKIKLSPRAV